MSPKRIVPRPLTSFFGRRKDLARLEESFASGARVVTLYGPGGIGKTRLALRYASFAAARTSTAGRS